MKINDSTDCHILVYSSLAVFHYKKKSRNSKNNWCLSNEMFLPKEFKITVERKGEWELASGENRPTIPLKGINNLKASLANVRNQITKITDFNIR